MYNNPGAPDSNLCQTSIFNVIRTFEPISLNEVNVRIKFKNYVEILFPQARKSDRKLFETVFISGRACLNRAASNALKGSTANSAEQIFFLTTAAPTDSKMAPLTSCTSGSSALR